MKLFVTDYDDTLYTSDINIEKTKKRLKKLRDNNTLIVIATGRSYPSIHNQTSFHNIYYDYIICSDGSVIYQKDDIVEVIFPIDTKIVKPYEDYYKNLNYEEIQYSYPEGYSNVSKNKDDLLGINICISSLNYTDSLNNSFEKLSKKYPEYNFLNYKHPNFAYLCVKPKGISKSSGIEYLRKKYNINKEEVYVIGDSSNDFEMIRDFNGSCVSCANDKVKSVSKKVYKSIDNYIDDIIKNLL